MKRKPLSGINENFMSAYSASGEDRTCSCYWVFQEVRGEPFSNCVPGVLLGLGHSQVPPVRDLPPTAATGR